MRGGGRQGRELVALPLLVAVLALAPGGAEASVPTAGDGLPNAGDVAGVVGAVVPGSAARGWVSILAPGTRKHAVTGVLRTAGSTPTVIVSRSVVAPSAAEAAAVLGALRRRPAARWARDDAAAARLAPRRLAGGAVVLWRDGAAAGRVAVAGPPRATERRIAQQAVAALRARLRRLQGQSAWQAATTLRGGRGATTRQALGAFSIAFGVRIPGVPPPRGQVDGPGDGTLALRWAVAHLGSMTAAQRAAVQRVLAGLRGPTGGVTARAALQKDWTFSAGYLARAENAASVLALKLGFPLTLQLFVGTSAVVIKGAMAVTEPVRVTGSVTDYSGTPTRCWITVHPEGLAQSGTYATEIITHEVFHCFQAQMSGDLDQFYGRGGVANDWMIEGGADWAACSAVPDALPEGAFSTWLKTPTTELQDRVYDGVGFLMLLTANGIDLWSRWPALARAPSGLIAYDRAVLGQNDQIRRLWASSLFQEAGRGPEWDPGAVPCKPATPAPEVQDLSISNGVSDYVRANQYAAHLYRLKSDADVLHFVVSDGEARLNSPSPAIDDSSLSDRYFCTDGQSDCSCPKLSRRTGPPPPRLDSAGSAVLAVSGGRSSVIGQVEGMTREQYCDVKLGLIVPGHAINKLYLGQTRRSALRAVPKLVPGGASFTPANAQLFILRGGPGWAFPMDYEIGLGLCNIALLKNAAALAACRQQLPKSSPDRIGVIETGNPGYVTSTGLGPGSAAADVIAQVGESHCVRDVPGNTDYSWDYCNVPDQGTRGTVWGFVGEKDAEVVSAVMVYDNAILPNDQFGT